MIERRRRFCGRDFLLGILIALIRAGYCSICGRILKSAASTLLEEQDISLLGLILLYHGTPALKFCKQVGLGFWLIGMNAL
jgi:hypothetical protein